MEQAEQVGQPYAEWMVDVNARVAAKKEERRMSSFEKYRTKKDGRRGNKCPRCNDKDCAGTVAMTLKERVPGRKASDRALDSASRALCEGCCVIVWDKLIEEFRNSVGEAGLR